MMGDQDYFGDMAVRSFMRCDQLGISVGEYFTPHQRLLEFLLEMFNICESNSYSEKSNQKQRIKFEKIINKNLQNGL